MARWLMLTCIGPLSPCRLPTPAGQGAAPRPWFERRGLPLRWQLPLGALVDLLDGEAELPWDVTVHYGSPAPEALATWPVGADAGGGQAALLNSLKEAAFICRGAHAARAMHPAPAGNVHHHFQRPGRPRLHWARQWRRRRARAT